ncbi:NAD(P)/FAD-dependent oxidoreductase [Microbacterium sp. APC 3898]|uniref:NAD(P)/FAD-dependent oxidoreductase n=1 Tax=Planococcus notacanthi TaxID=3035188 RepID=A0ABT7ZMB2_9BACL|nr:MULTISPECIES: NAD(P)/FAD-dependent oxidoreductase [Terrabacteria group]MDN3427978.1 NAD(P)/FAD-dependent oxidoreductase [Planococcus sp. APC 4016]MDN3498487.1 NAD(P)/FAD-dependent oxidoreductase [Microbacterium sp. APC 3898]
MLYDCAIIGGGPAGLNAALVLGRSRRKTLLFDDDNGRNLVTRESHGFITRDGIEPEEFKRLGRKDIAKYDCVEIKEQRIVSVNRITETHYELVTENGDIFHSIKIIIAAGLKEEQPNIPDIEKFYGTSLFSCPYCDGWDLRDQPLAVIADKQVFELAKKIYTWSRDLIVFTNGEGRLEEEDKQKLLRKGIKVVEDIIDGLEGDNGQLRSVRLEDGTLIDRVGGFVTPLWSHATPFAKELGCKLSEHGGILTDGYGRTNVWNVYAAGDASLIVPSQLVIAAGEGSAAAIGVNGDLVNEYFEKEQ